MSIIAYFISDHGLGHATRSVTIIRSLLECDLEVTVKVIFLFFSLSCL